MCGSPRVCTPFCLAGGLLDAGLAAAGLDELGAALFRAPAVPFDALPGDLRPRGLSVHLADTSLCNDCVSYEPLGKVHRHF